jgi:hypothetical protein
MYNQTRKGIHVHQPIYSDFNHFSLSNINEFVHSTIATLYVLRYCIFII